ncbi:hypothetical protein AGOR_G00230420 [Albula goreensis]|uniref:Reverse transcriptase/retrotransposon-derived protein RNase H-like domain-containing protein n=1 Tax=Albula goreensis TaxID=1534307 RepID=A0A8T3CQK6_9TELE|nr:hypothetical protein AGOR_G00230420 [Albula goreensis]
MEHGGDHGEPRTGMPDMPLASATNQAQPGEAMNATAAERKDTSLAIAQHRHHNAAQQCPDKMASIKDWPTPRNILELRSFLRLASYYRCFMRDVATIARPLHRLTDKGREFVSDKPCAVAFTQLHTTLTQSRVLAFPDLAILVLWDWDQHLLQVLWVYRRADQESTQCKSPALIFVQELHWWTYCSGLCPSWGSHGSQDGNTCNSSATICKWPTTSPGRFGTDLRGGPIRQRLLVLLSVFRKKQSSRVAYIRPLILPHPIKSAGCFIRLNQSGCV